MKTMWAVLTSSDGVTYGKDGETLICWSKDHASNIADRLNNDYCPPGKPTYRVQEVSVEVTYDKVVTEKVPARL